MPVQLRPGEPPFDPVLAPRSSMPRAQSDPRPGPYEAVYDVRLGYEGAVVEPGPAEQVVWFGGRGVDRR
jgi:hypothetical protein